MSRCGTSFVVHTSTNGSVNSKRAHPPSGHLWGICHLVGPGGGEFVSKSLPEGGKFVNSSRRGKYRSSFNISLKNMPIKTAFDISIKNIFNTYALKRYVWFSLYHYPTPQYFLHPSKKLLTAIVISLHVEVKKS